MSAVDCDSVINYKDLSADQALDTEFTRLRHSPSSTLDFRLFKNLQRHISMVQCIDRTRKTVRN